jgi:outer membrane protein assembly factor BamB
MRTKQKKLSIGAIVITLTISMLMITSFMALVLNVKAQDNVQPNAFLAINPNPVGVNQEVTVIAWLQPVTPSAAERFHNFTVTLTKPDGHTDTLGPTEAFPMGAAIWTYTPITIGEYTFKFNFPGQTFESTGEYYQPAESPITNLTVQEEAIPDWPSAELPNYYWTHPINAENREWSTISGEWLMCYYNSTYTGFGDAAAGYNPYSDAPRSSHIVWTKPATLGGLAGGEYESLSYYPGHSYGTYLSPPIIMNGKLYYNLEPSLWGHFRRDIFPGFVCVDLRTGEELWRNKEGGIDAGQNFVSRMPVGQGIFGFLWDLTGSTWDVFDPYDGKLLMTFDNATQGTDWWWEDPVVFGEDGTMFVYILDGYANSLVMWNSTRAFEGNEIIYTGSEGLPRFSITPGTYDWEKGIEWSITIPDRNVGWHTPYSIFGISDYVAIAKSGDGGNIVDFDIAYDITTGEEMWIHEKEEAVQTFFSVTGEGVFASFDLKDRRWTGYDIKTGAQLWQSDQNDYPWGTYIGYAPIIVDGKLLSGSFDGYLHAFDIEDGHELWKFYAGDSGKETTTGTYAMWEGPIVANGIAFVGTGEETPTQPLTRGHHVFAVDIETGEQIWNISGIMSLRAIADGYLLGYNAYDSLIYCFGKGPSRMSVSTQLTAVTKGSSVMITGTVIDESAGTKQDAIAALYPNGVPAVADESMSEWMEFLYMQKTCPPITKGVTVKLTAIDENMNEHVIGEAITDYAGNYGKSWKPPTEGNYHIMATFEGSESYYSSYATTYLVVDPVPSEDISIELIIILAVVAVAVIIIVGYWILRNLR